MREELTKSVALKTRSKANAKTRSKANAKTRSKANAKTQSKADAKTQSKANAKTQSKANAKTQSKANAKTQSKANAKIQSKANAKTQSTSSEKTQNITYQTADNSSARLTQKSFPKKSKNFLSIILKILVWGAAGITCLVLFFLIAYILVKGVPYLTPSLFHWNYTSENVSMLPAVFNTFLMVGFSLLISAPIGIFSAVFLVEYAKKDSGIIGLIRLAAETLSGIPSIVYGLFGMLLFVTKLGWGYSMLAGALTMAIMILPLIMRTTEEALLSVPQMYREGSYGLGAGKVKTIFTIILPTATPGILSGIILAIGRVVGETAALVFTAGTVASLPSNFFSSTRTLAVHMYTLSSEGLHMNEAYATAVILLLIVVLINALSTWVVYKFGKGDGNEPI